jgi:hypothetical protein
MIFWVIPVQTGIQLFYVVTFSLDSRFRGSDDFRTKINFYASWRPVRAMNV